MPSIREPIACAMVAKRGLHTSSTKPLPAEASGSLWERRDRRSPEAVSFVGHVTPDIGSYGCTQTAKPLTQLHSLQLSSAPTRPNPHCVDGRVPQVPGAQTFGRQYH